MRTPAWGPAAHRMAWLQRNRAGGAFPVEEEEMAAAAVGGELQLMCSSQSHAIQRRLYLRRHREAFPGGAPAAGVGAAAGGEVKHPPAAPLARDMPLGRGRGGDRGRGIGQGAEQIQQRGLQNLTGVYSETGRSSREEDAEGGSRSGEEDSRLGLGAGVRVSPQERPESAGTSRGGNTRSHPATG